MFDFRYHVVSLVAVFLALVVGIVVGVGISGRGVLGEAERTTLNERIAELRRELDGAATRADTARASEEYVEETYDVVMRDRLAGRGVAILFVGSVREGVRSAVVQAVSDAGGQPVRLRALSIPVDAARLAAKLERDEETAELAGENGLEELGRRLGLELVEGGETPLWDMLTEQLIEERSGGGVTPVDGVVVALTSQVEDEATLRFLDGLYAGLAERVPAVAVETTGVTPSTVDDFRRTDLSSVDNVDRQVGRVSLAVLLAGGPAGHYGVRDGAVVMPPVEPVPPPADG
jgi:hypothetical protein